MIVDPALDALLALDGQVIVIDTDGRYWVKFEVSRVAATPGRPHGLAYSLTLHGPDSGSSDDSRLVGFDNAHIVATGGPAGRRRAAWDHRHRLRRVRPYEYRDAAGLLADFWAAVDGVLAERGIVP